MIIGEHAKKGDLDINPVKAKVSLCVSVLCVCVCVCGALVHLSYSGTLIILSLPPPPKKALTNIRTVLKDEFVRLTPPRLLSLEEAITYINGKNLPISVYLHTCIFIFIYLQMMNWLR